MSVVSIIDSCLLYILMDVSINQQTKLGKNSPIPRGESPVVQLMNLARLFLLKPIPRDIDFDPKPEYLRMMENLRTSILALPEDVNGLRAEFNNLPTTV
jgi:hypothetical protein